MRIVFMGTPKFAVPILEKLVSVHEVVAVVSQPDRARDRKGNLIPTPTKLFAEGRGIKTFQFEKVSRHAEELKSLGADLFVTAAYGQLLSQEILDIPSLGILNVHASLLPRLRGSSPVQSALLLGDEVTGVTIMRTSLGMDEGDIVLQKKVEIGNMNAGELGEELSKVGAKTLLEAIDGLISGKITPVKQDNANATYCKKISKEQAQIDFGQPATKVYNTVRAFSENPIAYTFLRGERVKVHAASVADFSGEIRKIIFADKAHGLIVACGEGSVRLNKIQFPGKNAMSDIEVINGRKAEVGEKFGE